MRRIGPLLLAIAVLGLAVVTPGSLGDPGTRDPCADRASCPRAWLPAPITVAAGHVLGSVSYRIDRDGHAHRIPGIPSPYPPAAVLFPATGTWFMLLHGHLVVGRGRTPLWRSHRQIAPDQTGRRRLAADQLGVVMAGAHAVAFQHDHKLYLAQFGGAERPVANREMPLGWTAHGLYTYAYQGRRLLLRSDTGALLETVATRPLGSDYFVANGSLYFIAHGILMSAHGTRIRRLVSLASLGMSNPWLQPAGPLLEVQDNNRLVVLRPNGSVFASTRLPRDGGHAAGIPGPLAVSPHQSAVAFTSTAGDLANPNAADRAHGSETVYLLRPGAQSAIPINTERVTFRPCERGASFQWHGTWLLYSNSEGNLAAIDTTNPHHAIDMTSLAHSLPGTHDGFSASWT